MGLLASDPNDPLFGANMALAAGLVNGNFGGGLLGFGAAMREGQNDAIRRQYLQAQMEETRAQAEQRRTEALKVQKALEDQARIRAGLPSLFRQPGMVGGAPMPQNFAGTNTPQFSAPMGAGPMQQQPGGFDVQGALKLGITDPKELAAYAALADIGKPKVARTVEVMRNGKPTLIQLDERGQEVGSGYDQWKAPQLQSLGGRVAAIDPVTLQERGSFGMSQSPDSLASNAIAIRGQNMTDARAREANQAGKVPAGYRQSADGNGLEFIPGGPADPNAAKRAAPTEFQGKAAMFGNRAQEADRILSSLDGQYSPAAVNAKEALGKVWGVGGGLEAAGNLALPASAQKAEQAQRDFVNAVLRLESGAAISQSEFDNAKKQYFPQPFDSAAVKLQKSENRKRAIQGLLSNARPGSIVDQAENGGDSGGWKYLGTVK